MEENTFLGNDQFQQLCQRLNMAMNVWEIRMYLLGTLFSPRPFSLVDVLDDLLYDRYGDKQAVENEADWQIFCDQFKALHHRLSSASEPPPLKPLQLEFQTRDEKIEYILAKSEELAAFFSALDSYGASESFERSFQLSESQVGLWVINEMLLEFSTAYLDEEEILDQEISEMLVVIKLLHDSWPETFAEMGRLYLNHQHSHSSLFAAKIH